MMDQDRPPYQAEPLLESDISVETRQRKPKLALYAAASLGVILLVFAAYLFLFPWLFPPVSAPLPGAPFPSATLPADLPVVPGGDVSPLLPGADGGSAAGGALVLAMRDGNTVHLFTFDPKDSSLNRLTSDPWDDMHPSVNPQGTRLAFTSRKNGYWDLYILDLATRQITRITDTPQYDGAPSWSPDGQWLAYETMLDGNLEILLQNISDLSQEPIRLTDDPAADYAPDWSPAGRKIAFVSTRSGSQEIWTASLDTVDDRFTNISQTEYAAEDHPIWSPDGSQLAWGSDADGLFTIRVWDSNGLPGNARQVGAGYWPVWSPDGVQIISLQKSPGGLFLTFIDPRQGKDWLPGINLPAEIYGMDWPGTQGENHLATAAEAQPAALPTLWYPVLTVTPPPNGRAGIVDVPDLAAPYAYLHDAVDEAFQALRQQVAVESGWDFLDTLEAAYLPLTEPPLPGQPENWQYTGRSIAVNTMPLFANWMLITREDIGGEIYWRIYLRARYQDGSQGLPLRSSPWDMDARHSGDPGAYENGGRYGEIPDGYWVDFTEIASRFGWRRLPALPNWKSYYQGARINSYVHSAQLDWLSAMQELYPPEALWTFTPVPTRTPTASPTPRGTRTILPTKTITLTTAPTLTPTFRPTLTPLP